jgi:hypothetical protein
MAPPLVCLWIHYTRKKWRPIATTKKLPKMQHVPQEPKEEEE